MTSMRKRVFMLAGYNTVSMGSGRSAFKPSKSMPGLDYYIGSCGEGVLKQIDNAADIDECVMGNFMAARFNKQGHLGAFFAMLDEGLRYKPAVCIEGACASGALALISGIKSVLADTAHVVLAMGVEVQNTMKAVYGADVLAGAGWFPKRKEGGAYFFPGQFSDRAGACYAKFGRKYMRRGMARWYRNAIENARRCATAQEFENKTVDLEALALSEPQADTFTDYLNVYDCSKVSDGASGILILSEEGLFRLGKTDGEAVEVMGWGHVVDDITKDPEDKTTLSTMKRAVSDALFMAGITPEDIGTVETHDCFTIAGILSVEALGLAPVSKGADFVLQGNTAHDGKVPFNTTGGLIGWGHPTGATGIHMAVTIWQQLTGNAGEAQIILDKRRPYGILINMGGDDRTVVAIVFKRGGV